MDWKLGNWKLEIGKLSWSKGFSPIVKSSGLARIRAKALAPINYF